jgi:hypothetical protein
MVGLQSKTLMAAIAAGTLLAASPALAFTWQCTAANARGAKYAASASGVVSAIVRDRAGAKAVAVCRPNSAHPASCHVISCTRIN